MGWGLGRGLGLFLQDVLRGKEGRKREMVDPKPPTPLLQNPSIPWLKITASWAEMLIHAYIRANRGSWWIKSQTERQQSSCDHISRSWRPQTGSDPGVAAVASCYTFRCRLRKPRTFRLQHVDTTGSGASNMWSHFCIMQLPPALSFLPLQHPLQHRKHQLLKCCSLILFCHFSFPAIMSSWPHPVQCSVTSEQIKKSTAALIPAFFFLHTRSHSRSGCLVG